MSRTDKDRPYWVRSNDNTELRYDFHNHRIFGEERTHRTSNGKTLTVKFADYCTINEPEVGRSVKDTQPCGKVLHRPGHHVRNKPKKKIRKIYYWGPLRAARNVYLANATKDYNAFGEVDEDFYLQEDARYGLYGGGYWD